jgi:uncharacterized repeat protein (TIGR03803 family)
VILLGVLESVTALAQAPDGSRIEASPGFLVLHTFDWADGGLAEGRLAHDDAGNLFGATRRGGRGNRGTIFKISQDGTFKRLFDARGSDTGVVRDGAGNLYGTNIEDETVFKLAPDGTYSVLHTFTGGDDGTEPLGVVLDRRGNVYGCASGGAHKNGTIFRVDIDGTFTLLHAFSGGKDGGDPTLRHAGRSSGVDPSGESFRYEAFSPQFQPTLAVVVDPEGRVYGTTGGSAGGVAFSLVDGTYTILHDFDEPSDSGRVIEGSLPPGGRLALGFQGDLVGTTWHGGASEGGTLFEMSLSGSVKSLYRFASSDGQPLGSVTQDPSGNLYGMIWAQDRHHWRVFKLARDGALTILHEFNGTNGTPIGGLTLVGEKLFGMTSWYSASRLGDVFEITLP